MVERAIMHVDIRQVLKRKAPKMASKVPGFLMDYLARTIHQDEINAILTRYHEKDGVDFMRDLIDYFDLRLDIINENNISAEGRYVFVSNHPLGGLDGICLSAIIGSRYNGRIRYLVNDLLLNIPNLRSIFVPVNKHGSQDRNEVNQIKDAYESDNQIVTFPAGLCSRRINGKIQDTEWKKSFVRMAVKYERDIVPVYFDGRNSNFFYNLAFMRKLFHIKANLEMLYLPDEMFQSKHKHFRICFGEHIPWQALNDGSKPAEWARKIRDIVYNIHE